MPEPHPLTLAAVLFQRFADGIEARLHRRYRGIDPDLVCDAVTDAVIKVSGEPQLDPEADDFPVRLARMARDRLRTVLRGNQRRRNREQKFIRDVTDARPAAPSPLEALADAEAAAAARDRVAHTDEERALFDAWQLGVTDPGELARRFQRPRGEVVTTLARFRKRIERERDAREEDSS